MKNKIISVILAAMLAVSFIPTVTSAMNTNANANLTNISQSNNDSFMQRAKKAISKFYHKYKKAIVLCATTGLGTTTGLMVLSKKFFKYTYDDVINKYIVVNSNPSVSFDKWFERLGGTQSDIEKYCELSKEYDEGNIVSNCEGIIGRDVPRTVGNFDKISDYKIDPGLTENFMGKILNICAWETKLDYIQGVDRFLVLTINKFYQSNHRMWAIEDEAKIYYIYKTISQTVSNDKLHRNTLDQLTDRARESKYLKSYPLPKKIDYCDVDTVLLYKHYVPGGIDMLSPNQAIKLWDNIILDNNIVKNGRFDADKALDQVAIVVNSVFAKIYYEVQDVCSNPEVAQNTLRDYCKENLLK